MDTGRIYKPFDYLDRVPEEVLKQVENIPEENYVFDDVVSKGSDGKYLVNLEIDTRYLKSFAFNRELLSKPQDRSKSKPFLLGDLLGASIKSVRISRLYEEDKYKKSYFEERSEILEASERITRENAVIREEGSVYLMNL